MKKDITNRKDVELLVDIFYQNVRNNPVLSYIFEDIAKINWEKHLPKMYSFWSSVLLGEQSFSGNPMEKHIALSKITALTEREFNEWLLLFAKTTDDLFEGQIANEAKIKAGNIARLMLNKIQSV